MQQPYFIVVLAHSLHGRLRRVHVPYSVLYGVLALAAIGLVSLFGFVSSYARMAWKVSHYNDLRAEISSLRGRYDTLRKESEAKNQQLATFQLYATEVSTMFGLRSKIDQPLSSAMEAPLVPTLKESVAEYNLLRTAMLSRMQRGSQLLRGGGVPSLWPVNGRLMSYFGRRSDPFSGEGALHTGVDISVPTGTPVRASADGVVVQAGPYAGYGRIVVLDHGSGFSTYYAHLSRFEVIPGQTVRRGDIIAYSGATGRVTAPHVHYEVRMNGVAVNPYPYLQRAAGTTAARRDYPF